MRKRQLAGCPWRVQLCTRPSSSTVIESQALVPADLGGPVTLVCEVKTTVASARAFVKSQ